MNNLEILTNIFYNFFLIKYILKIKRKEYKKKNIILFTKYSP